MATQNAMKCVAALRSGEYEQGQHHLRSEDDGFCCLGVIADQFHKITGRGEWQLSEGGGFYEFVVDGEDNGAVLPPAVQEWVGFSTAGGTYDENDITQTLYGDNDDRGHDFDHIADTIEHNDALYRDVRS